MFHQVYNCNCPLENLHSRPGWKFNKVLSSLQKRNSSRNPCELLSSFSPIPRHLSCEFSNNFIHLLRIVLLLYIWGLYLFTNQMLFDYIVEIHQGACMLLWVVLLYDISNRSYTSIILQDYNGIQFCVLLSGTNSTDNKPVFNTSLPPRGIGYLLQHYKWLRKKNDLKVLYSKCTFVLLRRNLKNSGNGGMDTYSTA